MVNGPILKKVRRPINRAVPVSSSEAPVVSRPASPSVTKSEPVTEIAQPEVVTQNSPIVPSVQTNSNYTNTDSYDYGNNQYGTEYFEEEFSEPDNSISLKVFIITMLMALIIGFVMGHFLFKGNQVTGNGLQGIVVNTEVPRGRARCGVADRTQGCVLYIMNAQRQNVRAKDFYELAAQITGRQKFMIETGNLRYANEEIRPGDIAQINIPSL